MADSCAEDTVNRTITDLETRLSRIEFVTTGQQGETQDDDVAISKGTATARLQELEQKLSQLTSRSKAAQDLFNLYTRHPELFPSQDQHDPPTTLDPATLKSIILSSASSYQLTASRLTSILDVPVPDAESSSYLVELQPRVARLELLQAEQEKQVSELKKRSAAVLQRWYAVDVLGVGDCWAEAENRVTAIEQAVRRKDMTHEKATGIA